MKLFLLTALHFNIDFYTNVCPFEIGAYNDIFLPGLKKFAEAAHAGGGKAVMQLHHGGRESAYLLKKGEAIGPSALPSLVYRQEPREMTLDDIQETIMWCLTIPKPK